MYIKLSVFMPICLSMYIYIPNVYLFIPLCIHTYMYLCICLSLRPSFIPSCYLTFSSKYSDQMSVKVGLEPKKKKLTNSKKELQQRVYTSFRFAIWHNRLKKNGIAPFVILLMCYHGCTKWLSGGGSSHYSSGGLLYSPDICCH